MACGFTIAAAVWIQPLFQPDSAALPLHIALPWAVTAILIGAVAFKIGPRVTAQSRWSRFMTR